MHLHRHRHLHLHLHLRRLATSAANAAPTSPHVPTAANRAYTLNLVRTHDNENYLANLLHPTPAPHRRAHAALRAFNVELDRIRATVSNEDLARLRLAYFRDALGPLLSPHPPNPSATSGDPVVGPVPTSLPPVLDCLAEAVTTFRAADFTPLRTLVDARADFLAYPAFRTLPQLEAFVAAPHAALLALHASLLLNRPLPASVTDAVARAAPAVGLAIVLRAVPFHAAQRLTYMPRGTHIDPASLLAPNKNSLPLFAAVARVANQRLDDAHIAVRELADSRVRPAFWPLVMARLYLERLGRAENNPFDRRLNLDLRTTWHLALQMRLLAARLFRR